MSPPILVVDLIVVPDQKAADPDLVAVAEISAVPDLPLVLFSDSGPVAVAKIAAFSDVALVLSDSDPVAVAEIAAFSDADLVAVTDPDPDPDPVAVAEIAVVSDITAVSDPNPDAVPVPEVESSGYSEESDELSAVSGSYDLGEDTFHISKPGHLVEAASFLPVPFYDEDGHKVLRCLRCCLYPDRVVKVNCARCHDLCSKCARSCIAEDKSVIICPICNEHVSEVFVQFLKVQRSYFRCDIKHYLHCSRLYGD